MGADTQPGTRSFAALEGERYINLTTFRRDGTGVATPVWFVEHHGGLALYTAATAGKVKRLRHTAHVTLAPCTVRGAVTGPTLVGNARLLEDAAEIVAIRAALLKKYGFQRRALLAIETISGIFSRRARLAQDAYITITPLGF
ncbi:MAG: PPOX class F420-dependent oxidoreductase [Ktedonobacterales bacterium]|nr:PPOX class F420-dependent oxidoreductase [Ktedonobacterales bacterium]